MFFTIQNFSKLFCRFPSNFLQDFCLLVLVRLFFPFFFSLISFFMHLRENFEPMGFWDFWCFRCFLSKLIIGFLLWDDINMIFVVYFDQFDELGKIEISRAWNYPIWGFCSIKLNLVKLACVIHFVIIYSYLICVMINWSIC